MYRSTILNQTATIIRYYDGCSTGNLDVLASTLHPWVVHYFLAPNIGSTPVIGAEHLARYWRKVTNAIDARWVVDHALVEGAEAVVEWTMFWCPGGSGDRVATRGAEWFIFRESLIREIRSYYQQLEQTSELDGFPYSDRGYSTVDAERSALHQADRDSCL